MLDGQNRPSTTTNGTSRRRFLEAAARRVAAMLEARLVDADGTVTVEVDVAGARYLLHGWFAGPGLIDRRETVVVLLERNGDGVPDDGALRTRFRLTAREVEVARLIARGLPNSTIASTLGISIHTAERHTERVLHKLRAPSRAAAAAMLLTPGTVGSLPDATAARLPDR